MSSVRASIIIPAYNAARTLRGTLRALSQQSLPRSDYEIIVVDDGSTDGTSAVAAEYAELVLRQPNRGPAAARNFGIAASAAPIVLFTDADTEPTPAWVETLLRAFDDPSIVGVKGSYRTHQSAWVARLVQVEYEEKYARLARAKRMDLVDTYSAGYRRSVFVVHGGFDESFPSASSEDKDFSFRLAAENARLVFLPEAVVYHQHAATLGAYGRRKFKLGFWNVRVHEHFPGKLVSDSHTPLNLRIQVVLAPLLLAALLVWPYRPGAGFFFAGLSILYGLSMWPFLRLVARREPGLLPLGPIFITCRACALSAGIVAGVANEACRVMLAEKARDVLGRAGIGKRRFRVAGDRSK